MVCAENLPFGFINGSSWKPDSSSNLLAKPSLITERIQREDDRLIVRTHETDPVIVEIILNNYDADAHPFHLVRAPQSLGLVCIEG
jgi:hypothetical protein